VFTGPGLVGDPGSSHTGQWLLPSGGYLVTAAEDLGDLGS
jgi:hypothetical protein